MSERAVARVVYQNPWITVREEAVAGPAGQPRMQPVIDTRVATGVIAMTPDHHVYLVGQYRYAMREYSWEIIEGGGDPGEAPVLTAQRELKEEAGLGATAWQNLGPPIQLSPPYSSEIGHLFLATGLTDVGAEPEGTEELALLCVPLTEAIARVRSGEIKDGMSIIALLLLEQQFRATGHALVPDWAAGRTPLPTYPDPWTLVSTAPQYDTDALHIREDQVLRPDGNPGIYGIVSAGPSASVLVQREDGRMLLHRRIRPATGTEAWELPNAVGPRGSEPLAVAERALATACHDSAHVLQPLAMDLQLTNCHACDRAHLYSATLHGAPADTPTQRWVTPAEAHRLMAHGEILDALSIIGILLHA